MAGDYLLDDGAVLAGLGLVNNVGPVEPRDGLVRGYLDDIELIDGGKFLLLGQGGARHAGELVVKSEIVLEGYRREGLVLALDVDVLLGLDGLVQSLAVAAAEHDAAGELIDDEHLAVLDDVVDIPLHDAVGAQSLVYVVGQGGVFDVGIVLKAEGALRLRDAARRQGGGTGLFVDDVVGVDILVLFLLGVGAGVDLFAQAGDEVVGLTVQVGALVALSGNDKGRSRLVDEDGVDLVDDGKDVAALDAGFLVYRHIVAQIVKAHLVVGAVGDVGGVGLFALLVREPVDDKPDLEAHEAVHLAHPFAVAPGKIVVDGHDVDALAGERVQV